MRLAILWTLENRGRRNNIRIIGLKEGKDETGKVAQYVEKILYEGLSLTGSGFEIQRTDQPLAPIPNPNEPPRTIMIRFLCSSA